MATITEEIQKRRTFAIISHPDAGKTTLTEKLLLFGGAIHVAGAVKSNKIKKTATSDWMEIEKEREDDNAKKKHFSALCRTNYRAVYSLGNEPIYFY